jgi:hypothetical protein
MNDLSHGSTPIPSGKAVTSDSLLHNYDNIATSIDQPRLLSLYMVRLQPRGPDYQVERRHGGSQYTSTLVPGDPLGQVSACGMTSHDQPTRARARTYLAETPPARLARLPFPTSRVNWLPSVSMGLEGLSMTVISDRMSS